MKKAMKRIAALCMAAAVVCTALPQSAEPVRAEEVGQQYGVENQMQPTVNYKSVQQASVDSKSAEIIRKGIEAGQNYCSTFELNTYNDEWGIFAYLRSGRTADAKKKAAYYNSIVNKLSASSSFGENKATDLERVVLGLQAYGLDASNIGGSDLLARIYNYKDSLATMGANDVSFALLALDSNNTVIPADANWTRKSLVDALLNYQTSTGGFSLGIPKESENGSASVNMTDMTAMCLTALAPYTAMDGVQTAIDQGVNYLKQNLNAQAGYGNSSSDAQVITALSALNIDCTAESSGFTVGENNLLTSLNSYLVDGVGFKWMTTDSAAGGMASIQALYALDAYQRFRNGSNRLYDFTDTTITSYQQFAAENPEAVKDAEGSGNQTEQNVKVKVTACKVTLEYKAVKYTGKAQKPKVKVTYNGKTLKSGSDYTLTYKNNKNAGSTASVTIAGKGSYTGTKKLTFAIVKAPKKQSVQKLKNASKAFTVTWTKDKNSTGYEIRYAKDSKFKKNAQTIMIKSKNTASRKVTKLSKKTKYYVKVRAYKTVNGVRIYGSWSNYKKVTTK